MNDQEYKEMIVEIHAEVKWIKSTIVDLQNRVQRLEYWKWYLIGASGLSFLQFIKHSML